MAEFQIMRELRLQVWIALTVSKRIQKENKRIQCIIIGSCDPAAVAEIKLVLIA